jgi:hypothetical protein
MKYREFETAISPTRIDRYLVACRANTRKAMTLYRLNLRMSQELYTVVSCFEVTLRNAIDRHYTRQLGTDWLRDAVAQGGIFDVFSCSGNSRVFARAQFLAGNQTLLRIFPAKPRSTQQMQYNNVFVFNQLAKINMMRNRIAHHEPICFLPGYSVNDSNYTRQHYSLIRELFQWMQVDEKALLYGLDHIYDITQQIDQL